MNDINKIPYFYDDLWKKHELAYLSFHNYEFIKDLSFPSDKYLTIILLFKFNNNYILRGYQDGILFPYINTTDLENIHGKRKNAINKLYNKIKTIIETYNIKNTKIYVFPYQSYVLKHNIYELINVSSKNELNLLIYYSLQDVPLGQLYDNMKNRGGGSSTKSIIKSYLNKEIYDTLVTNIYFGSIPDDIFNQFVDKHYSLSGKKTKPTECWEIIKSFIIQKKGILIVGDDNYILFFVSNNYSSYTINACNKKDDICTILLYIGIEWLVANGYNFIHFGKFGNESTDKLNNIQSYKKSLCNKIFTNYYLEY